MCLQTSPRGTSASLMLGLTTVLWPHVGDTVWEQDQAGHSINYAIHMESYRALALLQNVADSSTKHLIRQLVSKSVQPRDSDSELYNTH
ncbi:unnamed protein product [Coregonus sp. 'balchen']|nr:unnamed protein product [Coregonus sp. 'balchen']